MFRGLLTLLAPSVPSRNWVLLATEDITCPLCHRPSVWSTYRIRRKGRDGIIAECSECKQTVAL